MGAKNWFEVPRDAPLASVQIVSGVVWVGDPPDLERDDYIAVSYPGGFVMGHDRKQVQAVYEALVRADADATATIRRCPSCGHTWHDEDK